MTDGTDDDDFDDDFDDDLDEDDDEDDDLDEDDEDLDDEDADDGAKKQTNSLKWGLIAVVVLAVVALILVGVVLFGGDPSKDAANAKSGSTSSAAAGIASAGDTAAVAVIIDDPTCVSWNAISTNTANTLARLGHGEWNDRDRSIPAAQWTDEQKKEYLAAGQVLKGAATQTLGLIKLTPHRVMRELYEQFVAYARAFVEHIPTYTAADAALDGTAHSAGSALAAICAATGNGAAATRGPLVEPLSAPSKTASPVNPSNPPRFLPGANAVCTDWKTALDKFGTDTAEWQSIDPTISAIYWSQQQRMVNLEVGKVMHAQANKLQQLGRRSNNPVLADFADLSAQYRRAFVNALSTYDPTDNYLANAATYLSTTVLGACDAAGH